MTVTSFDSISFDHFSIDPAPLGDGEQTISAQITVTFKDDDLINGRTGENNPLHLYGFTLGIYGTHKDSPDFITSKDDLHHVTDFKRPRMRLDCGTVLRRQPCRFVEESTPLFRFPNPPVLFGLETADQKTYQVTSGRLTMGVDTSDLDKARADPIFIGGGFFGGFPFQPDLEDKTFLYAEVVSAHNLHSHLSALSEPLRNVFEDAAA